MFFGVFFVGSQCRFKSLAVSFIQYLSIATPKFPLFCLSSIPFFLVFKSDFYVHIRVTAVFLICKATVQTLVTAVHLHISATD